MTSSKKYNAVPSSKIFPILSLNKFAYCLGISREKLEGLANHIDSCYLPFKKKRGDKERLIDNPQGLLKEVQKRINDRILSRVELPEHVIGGVRGRKPFEHPQRHTGKAVVVTLDIKDCFPSITNKMIFDVWHKQLGCSSEVSHLAAKLTTRIGHLPLGASSSLAFSNLALRPCLESIAQIAQSCSFVMGQYVDDLAFSGDTLKDDFITRVISEFQKYGFKINRKKVKVMRANEPQFVIKRIVNKKVSISLEERDKVRAAIHELENTSPNDKSYTKQYRSVKGRISNIRTLHPGLAEKMMRRFDVLAVPKEIKE